ncbi:MAG TPA: phosphoadenylyl-sulfate reductase [Anaerolineales bacterium]|nr:phosphoadenylyl-sulfate reductase [Anaerolineales bacterium]
MSTQESEISFETADWSPATAKEAGSRLEGSSPETILRWGFEQFAPSIVMATGFGPEGIALMHFISEIRPETIVFYLDTDLLFSHTYELRDELVRRLGIRFERVHSGISLSEQRRRHGDKLWERDPDTCCHIRKVIPQRQFLSSYSAWITGIRRDQTAFRANTGIIEWDYANKMVKINPLAAWTSEQVWDHIHAHDLPYNPLHDYGYPSIGCWTCTNPVQAGQDPRSGRWSGTTKTECGLHLASIKKQ